MMLLLKELQDKKPALIYHATQSATHSTLNSSETRQTLNILILISHSKIVQWEITMRIKFVLLAQDYLILLNLVQIIVLNALDMPFVRVKTS